VIRSFRDRETEKVFNREPSRRWSRDLQQAARRKLVMLDAAEGLVAHLLSLGRRRCI